MAHGNPIDWDGRATEDAVVVAGVESGPERYVAFNIAAADTQDAVGDKLKAAWDAKYKEHVGHNGQGRVTFPGDVCRTRIISFCKGAILIQDVPDCPDVISVVGFDVSSPNLHP